MAAAAAGRPDLPSDSAETQPVLNPDPRVRPEPQAPPEPVAAELAEAIPDQPWRVAPLLRRWALRLAPLVLLAAAGAVLWREFHHLSLSEVLAAMDAWGWDRIALALGLSIFSFFLMGVVEWLGVRWAGARVPWVPVMGASFLANAIAHAVGANLLVSGAVRARLYDRYGVTLTQVAATTLFGGMSFAVGLAALGGSGLLFSEARQIEATAIPILVARVLGVALVVFSLGYIGLCAVRRSPIVLLRRSFVLPSALDAAAQVVIGVVDNGVAAAIIWLLLPPGAVHYQTFVGAYAVSAVAGLVSTVPAGAGVFEGSISALLPNADPAPLAAAFLGYRLAYYLLPLIIACVALAADTLARRGR
jgi:uncharacterized membrane protein YbhN (UPF0104 family)